MAYAIAALVVVLRLGLSKVPAIAIVVGPPLALEALLRMLAAPQLKIFNQQMMRLLQTADREELFAYYQSQRLLHFAGPSFAMLDKLGLIHAHFGEHEAAAQAYKDALDEAPGKRQVEIAIKLADALRQCGRLEEAERYYREIAAVTDEHPPTNQHLAQLILARYPKSAEALELLKKADKHARHDGDGAAIRCELARLHIARGELDAAEAAITVAKKDLGGSDNLLVNELIDQAEAALAEARGDAPPAKQAAAEKDATSDDAKADADEADEAAFDEEAAADDAAAADDEAAADDAAAADDEAAETGDDGAGHR